MAGLISHQDQSTERGQETDFTAFLSHFFYSSLPGPNWCFKRHTLTKPIRECTALSKTHFSGKKNYLNGKSPPIGSRIDWLALWSTWCRQLAECFFDSCSSANLLIIRFHSLRLSKQWPRGKSTWWGNCHLLARLNVSFSCWSPWQRTRGTFWIVS